MSTGERKWQINRKYGKIVLVNIKYLLFDKVMHLKFYTNYNDEFSHDDHFGLIAYLLWHKIS